MGYYLIEKVGIVNLSFLLGYFLRRIDTP